MLDVYKRQEGIFAGGMGFDVFFQGAIVTVLVMISYITGHALETGEWVFTNSHDGTDVYKRQELNLCVPPGRYWRRRRSRCLRLRRFPHGR